MWTALEPAYRWKTLNTKTCFLSFLLLERNYLELHIWERSLQNTSFNGFPWKTWLSDQKYEEKPTKCIPFWLIFNVLWHSKGSEKFSKETKKKFSSCFWLENHFIHSIKILQRVNTTGNATITFLKLKLNVKYFYWLLRSSTFQICYLVPERSFYAMLTHASFPLEDSFYNSLLIHSVAFGAD